MACSMVITGGIGIVQHPAEPQEQDAAAIWRLPIMQMLMAAPGVTRRRLSQGLFGAVSPKPTDLLVINMPELPTRTEAVDDETQIAKVNSHWAGPQRLLTHGYLKEYPPAMCGALASALRKGLDDLSVVECDEPPLADYRRGGIHLRLRAIVTTWVQTTPGESLRTIQSETRSLRHATMDRLPKKHYRYIFANELKSMPTLKVAKTRT